MALCLVQKDSADLIIKVRIIVVFSGRAESDDVLYIGMVGDLMIERAICTIE